MGGHNDYGSLMASQNHAGNENPTSYMSRLQTFRNYDIERDAMIQELIHRYDVLKQHYDEKCDDFNNEKESRRMYQNQLKGLKENMRSLKETTESNPFVFAILDGDGAIFSEELLKKGADGGSEAAYRLHTEIKEHIKESYPEANIQDWTIVVQVVLNLEGLSKKLFSTGVVPEYQTLANFGRGFGRSQPLFSFVDVGAGKESADYKVREMFRLMARVSQCKHIFFGPCHDNGYLPALEPYKRDVNVAPRLTLLQTTPAEQGFIQLGFKMTEFTSVFRSTPLSDRPGQAARVAPSVYGLPPQGLPPPSSPVKQQQATPAPAAPVNRVPGPRIANAAAASVISPPPKQSSPPPRNNSWSAVSKTGSGQTIDIGSSKKKASPRSYLLNGDSERLDDPLPRPDPIADKKFKELMNENGVNFCNTYYLQGGCDGSNCGYYHGEKLPPGLLNILRHKVRGIACGDGSYCTKADCIYGHHCKWGNECTLSWCRFAKSHEMDMKPHLRVFEDGNVQTLAR